MKPCTAIERSKDALLSAGHVKPMRRREGSQRKATWAAYEQRRRLTAHTRVCKFVQQGAGYAHGAVGGATGKCEVGGPRRRLQSNDGGPPKSARLCNREHVSTAVGRGACVWWATGRSLQGNGGGLDANDSASCATGTAGRRARVRWEGSGATSSMQQTAAVCAPKCACASTTLGVGEVCRRLDGRRRPGRTGARGMGLGPVG
ncbi:MAG: hypothetical protein J3K34DRAFT_9926 [Monoraphidium minutum]|nr:MAG: hypothetical protein J3K34DRAFT_9926 [Monoraphidium minutum]